MAPQAISLKTQATRWHCYGPQIFRGLRCIPTSLGAFICFLVLSLFSPCYAQTRLFEGFSGGLKIGALGFQDKYRNDSESNPSNDVTGRMAVQAQYGLSLGGRVVIGFGASVSVADSHSASANSDAVLRYKASNPYTVNFEPGYAFTPNALVYGKLAFHNLDDGVSGVPHSASSMMNLSGVGYGLGIRSMLTSTVYVQFEYQQLDFEKYNRFSPDLRFNGNQSSIQLGYKF